MKKTIAFILVLSLILCGCSSAPADVSEEKSEVIQVSNVNEFIDAIGPDREIRLEPGIYNLTKATAYREAREGEYYLWESYGFDGEYELLITGVNNLRITGTDAEIVTEPRTSNVLSFNACTGVVLSGLTIGHTEEPIACQGGVVKLYYCRDITIDDCKLFGCGTIGVDACKTNNLRITGTDIYQCSSLGIMFNSGEKLLADNCRIYDCGSDMIYGRACGAVQLSNSKNLCISNCEIYSNFAATAFGGYDNSGAVIFNINLHDNRFDSVFENDMGVEFSSLSLENNLCNTWFSYDSTGSVSIDGENLTADDLDSIWGSQLASSGLGTVPIAEESPDYSGAKEVHVNTVDEFLKAIGPDTVIYIDAAQLNLTQATGYGSTTFEDWSVPEFGTGYYAWGSCYDGAELYIGNVDNFHITGGEIVTEPRYANVLSYYDCSNISLDNVKLGHTPEQGECTGGVLNFIGVSNIIVESCDLYGCGILGISTANVKGLHVQNTLIHDCSYGAAVLNDTENAAFISCSIENCPEPHFVLNCCNNFSWNGTLMDSYASFSAEDVPN